MDKLDHERLSRILGSTIGPTIRVHHGAIGSNAMASEILQRLRNVESDSGGDESEEALDAAREQVKAAFLSVRDDNRAPDLYVADPRRNERFLEACKDRGLDFSAADLNRLLLNLRKASKLTGLKSERTRIPYHDVQFAALIAYASLKSRTGASVDDVLGDPSLAKMFDTEARRLAPGRDAFLYRWALLGSRKNREKLENPSALPDLDHTVPIGSAGVVPDAPSLFLIRSASENLYVQAVPRLRSQIELVNSGDLLDVLTSGAWNYAANGISLDFGRIELPKDKRKASDAFFHKMTNSAVERYRPLFSL